MEDEMNRQLPSKTTLGDLVYALTEDVRRDVHDEKQVYEIVSDLLAAMITPQRKINRSNRPMELTRLAS
jgi:hypothetical protein